MTEWLRIEVAGENALIVYCGDTVSETVTRRVRLLDRVVRERLGERLVDTIPSYASVLVIYRSDQIGNTTCRELIRECTETMGNLSGLESQGLLITLPVWYGVDAGEDLAQLAEAKGLTTEEVVQIHQSGEYRVYAIGFAPGFAYLGEVDERIATPRLATPRQNVAAGAVGIADRQTAVYPAQSPGGWNLIGRCPLQMLDPHSADPMPVRVGDRVRFEAIDRATYLKMGGEE
jgi:KipI family sensor histidine kinase inhibitor